MNVEFLWTNRGLFFFFRRGILFARVMDVPGVGVRDDCAFEPKTTDLPSALHSLHLEDESAKSERGVPRIPSIRTHTNTQRVLPLGA